MLRYSKILGTTLFLFSMYILPAQSTWPSFSGLPLKQVYFPLFGKDIVINDQPTQNQRSVAICSAFNGWLYAAYQYHNETYNTPVTTLFRSIDNGLTWSLIFEEIIPLQNFKMDHISLLATGDSISNIKIFYSYLEKDINSAPSEFCQGYVMRFNGETGAFEQQILNEMFCYDIAISGDLPYPASTSNPSSIGVLYSKYSTNGDSIIFKSSSNGGLTLNNKKVLATTTQKRFYKVALAYGRSQSFNSGRYFAVWEERDSGSSNTGRLYTAHSEPNFNSPFTVPVRIDTIDASTINNAKNPSISCQYNDVDNDSSNLTAIILFDKYLSSSNGYDIVGLLNRKAATTSYFTKFSPNTSTDNRKQSSIAFNPFDSTFMVTYFDSTTQQLPFLQNTFNIQNQNSWQINEEAYNDYPNLGSPFPNICLNFAQKQGAIAWTSERSGGNGVAMFDAPYSTYTSISEINKANEVRLISVYPNPCGDELNIAFKLKKTEKVTIHILSILGRNLETVTNQFYSEGKHVVKINVSTIPSGTYLYNFNSGDGVTATGKFSIIR
jgi:hypothetical protein